MRPEPAPTAPCRDTNGRHTDGHTGDGKTGVSPVAPASPKGGDTISPPQNVLEQRVECFKVLGKKSKRGLCRSHCFPFAILPSAASPSDFPVNSQGFPQGVGQRTDSSFPLRPGDPSPRVPWGRSAHSLCRLLFSPREKRCRRKAAGYNPLPLFSLPAPFPSPARGNEALQRLPLPGAPTGGATPPAGRGWERGRAATAPGTNRPQPSHASARETAPQRERLVAVTARWKPWGQSWPNNGTGARASPKCFHQG